MTVTIKLPANGNNNMTPRKAVIKVIKWAEAAITRLTE